MVDQSGAWNDVKKANDITAAALKTNPDIKGVFVQDDGMAPGADKAAKAAGKKIKIVGIGGSCGGEKLVKSGELYASTVQDPWDDAEAALNAATNVAAGKEIPKITYLDPPVIDKTNVDEFDCHF